jgi:hypothetical protein
MRHPFRTLLYELLVEPIAELWRKTTRRSWLTTPRNSGDSESECETRVATFLPREPKARLRWEKKGISSPKVAAGGGKG